MHPVTGVCSLFARTFNGRAKFVFHLGPDELLTIDALEEPVDSAAETLSALRIGASEAAAVERGGLIMSCFARPGSRDVDGR